MIDFDTIEKPKCYKILDISNNRDCESKRKNKGNSREKCQVCDFRFYHKFMMKYDEEYAKTYGISLKIEGLN